MLNFLSGVLRLLDMTFNACLHNTVLALFVYFALFLIVWVLFWFLIRGFRRL